MSTRLLIATSCYLLVALISILFGVIYLVKQQFMPYHQQALGMSWSELDAKMRVLILALMRATGGGFLATGIALLLLLIFPWRAGNLWSLYGLPAIALCTSCGSLSATLLITTQTPGKPPIVLSLLTIALTLLGFILSVI